MHKTVNWKARPIRIEFQPLPWFLQQFVWAFSLRRRNMVSPSPMLVVLSSVLPPFGISGCCGGSLSHVVFLLVVGVNLSWPRFASTINLRLRPERKTSQAYLIRTLEGRGRVYAQWPTSTHSLLRLFLSACLLWLYSWRGGNVICSFCFLVSFVCLAGFLVRENHFWSNSDCNLKFPLVLLY